MITKSMYYRNLDVLFELIHQLRDKECMFIPYVEDNGKLRANAPIRWLMAQYIDMLKRHFTEFRFIDKDMNIYHSLATYKNRPMFSYAWKYKSQEQKIWMDRFHEYVTGYDFFLETDSDNLDKSIKQDGIRIRDFLNKYKVMFSVSFSGSKGLHFFVPYEEFEFLGLPVFDREGLLFDVVTLFRLLARRIKYIFAIEQIDDTVFDVKRVRKIPYSWDVKSGLIALPLTDYQLDNFNKEIVNPVTVLKEGVRKRGLLYRNTEVPKEEREQNIKWLLSDLEIEFQKV